LIVNATFRDHGFQRNVPGTGLDALDALAVVSETEQAGASPGSAQSEIGQGTIIEAPAHAETMTVGIESDEGHEQEVKVPGQCEPTSAGDGLRDAEAVGTHAVAWTETRKPEFSSAPRGVPGSQDGEIASFAACVGQEGAWIEFAVGRPIQCNPSGAKIQAMMPKPLRHSRGVLALLARRKLSTRSSEFTALRLR
jgi:hypothetical protein